MGMQGKKRFSSINKVRLTHQINYLFLVFIVWECGVTGRWCYFIFFYLYKWFIWYYKK